MTAGERADGRGPAEQAEDLVVAWVRAYTRGLGDGDAVRRVAELRSDAWEQRHRGREVGEHPVAVAASMVARMLAGVPADLAWRHQARRAVHRSRTLHEGGRPMGRWITDNWWVALGAVNAAIATVLGIGLPFEDRTPGSVIGGVQIALLGLGTLAVLGVVLVASVVTAVVVAEPGPAHALVTLVAGLVLAHLVTRQRLARRAMLRWDVVLVGAGAITLALLPAALVLVDDFTMDGGNELLFTMDVVGALVVGGVLLVAGVLRGRARPA